ncbi:MAG TPA: CotH kinase family protein, partial [Myxococcota bacterium]
VTPVFRFAPWDFNQSFGQSWETSRTGFDMPIDAGWPMQTNRLWERLIEGPYVREIYGRNAHVWLSEASVSSLFEEMVLETDRAARKDASVWADAYRDHFRHDDLGDYDSEVALVRAWIVSRWQYLREHTPPPAFD